MSLEFLSGRVAKGVTLTLLLFISVSLAFAGKPDRDVVTLKKGMNAQQLRGAKVVQLDKNATPDQVLQLRDDQTLETKNGRHMTVASYRRIQQVFALGRASGTVRHEMQVPIFKAVHGPGVPIRAGETPQQLLSRKDNDVIRLRSGSVVSGKQMKALVPYVERTYGVDLHTDTRHALNGRAVKIKNPSDLKALAGAPDNTILESKKGTRVRLGDLRRALGSSAAHSWLPTVEVQK